MPAAAMGPGVGGAIVCVAIKPKAKAMAGAARVMPAFFDRLLFNGESNKKPLSAKTGMGNDIAHDAHGCWHFFAANDAQYLFGQRIRPARIFQERPNDAAQHDDDADFTEGFAKARVHRRYQFLDGNTRRKAVKYRREQQGEEGVYFPPYGEKDYQSNAEE